MGFEQSIVVLPIDERQEARTLDRSRGEGHFPRCDRMTAAVQNSSQLRSRAVRSAPARTFMLPWSFSEETAAEKHMAQLQHKT